MEQEKLYVGFCNDVKALHSSEGEMCSTKKQRGGWWPKQQRGGWWPNNGALGIQNIVKLAFRITFTLGVTCDFVFICRLYGFFFFPMRGKQYFLV